MYSSVVEENKHVERAANMQKRSKITNHSLSIINATCEATVLCME